jgi:dephospho-CoA kinase
MLKVGITGGIGSGKSTVCKIFELLDIPVYYADDEAKKILNNDVLVKEQIIQAFGNDILDKQGLIERPKLAAIVFNNKEKLQQLNSIVHPAVAKHFENWLQEHKTYPYILKEAAILFESGSYKQVNKIISVVAPTEIRINRTIKRDNISKELALQRMQNQISDEEKIKRSDFIIHNDEMQLIIPQVIDIHKKLIANS